MKRYTFRDLLSDCVLDVSHVPSAATPVRGDGRLPAKPFTPREVHSAGRPRVALFA